MHLFASFFWFFLVARNAIIDYYRTRQPTAEMSESLPAQPLAHDLEMDHTFNRNINTV